MVVSDLYMIFLLELLLLADLNLCLMQIDLTSHIVRITSTVKVTHLISPFAYIFFFSFIDFVPWAKLSSCGEHWVG